jgi:hypothetical protein
MANSFSDAIDSITADVQSHWRKRCVLPMLVDNRFDPQLKEMHKGAKLGLFDISDMSVQDVEQVIIPTTFSDVVTEGRDLSLDYWKEVRFKMTPKDYSDINAGVMPLSIKRSINALAEYIDQSIYNEAKKYAYQHVGTAGTTPFASSANVISEAKRRLTSGDAPLEDRYFAVDEFAMYNASNLGDFKDADKAGSNYTKLTGQVAYAWNFGWYESNNIPTHTTTASGTYAVDASGSIGATTITLDNGAGALPTAMVVGDVLSIAGSTQQYVVTSYTAGSTDAAVGIFPALDQAIADGDAVTVAASHVLNLAFHQESIAMASRPLLNLSFSEGQNNLVREVVPDPMTGMVLEFIAMEGWAVNAYAVRCLWGVTVPPRKEGGIVRVMG